VEKEFEIGVELPFDLKSSFYTSSTFQAVAPQSGSIIAHEPFLMCVEIQSISRYPLQISTATLELLDSKILCQSTTYQTTTTSNMTDSPSEEQQLQLQSSLEGKKEPAMLNNGDKFTVWFNLLSGLAGNDVDLGTFRLEWSRYIPLASTEGKDEVIQKRKQKKEGRRLLASEEGLKFDPTTMSSRVVITETLVPPLKIVRSPFSTVVEVPPHGVVGIPFTLSLSITNHTHRIEDFNLQVKDSNETASLTSGGGAPSFLFAGTKQSSFKILPLSSYTIHYNLVPMTAGKVPLPNYLLTSKRFSREISGNKQTRFVFIRPSQ
jgi:hypothetical protein